MILPLLALLQAAPTADDRCAALLRQQPAAALAEVERWRIGGGGFHAQRCAGMVEAGRERWAEAAGRFDAAARAAEVAHDAAVADLWAQAGNAWLAAGQPARARTALDAALTAGTLTGQALGEAQVDHARAAVGAGDLDGARGDLDHALTNAAADPLAWLLSATLARRQNDTRRARTDIAEALKRSPDDASVQLEAGNIAALAGDEAGARAGWAEAARLRPAGAQGQAALTALRQFDAASTKAPPAR